VDPPFLRKWSGGEDHMIHSKIPIFPRTVACNSDQPDRIEAEGPKPFKD